MTLEPPNSPQTPSVLNAVYTQPTRVEATLNDLRIRKAQRKQEKLMRMQQILRPTLRQLRPEALEELLEEHMDYAIEAQTTLCELESRLRRLESELATIVQRHNEMDAIERATQEQHRDNLEEFQTRVAWTELRWSQKATIWTAVGVFATVLIWVLGTFAFKSAEPQGELMQADQAPAKQTKKASSKR